MQRGAALAVKAGQAQEAGDMEAEKGEDDGAELAERHDVLEQQAAEDAGGGAQSDEDGGESSHKGDGVKRGGKAESGAPPVFELAGLPDGGASEAGDVDWGEGQHAG